MTTTQIATIDQLEHEANAVNLSRFGALTVYATDSSTRPSFTVPGFVYFLSGEPVSRDEAVCYLQGCGVLCPVHGDVRDTSVVR